MKTRRSFWGTCGLVAALLFGTIACAQQPYPHRPVRVVAMRTPGGGADTLARILFGELAGSFGQQFVYR